MCWKFGDIGLAEVEDLRYEFLFAIVVQSLSEACFLEVKYYYFWLYQL